MITIYDKYFENYKYLKIQVVFVIPEKENIKCLEENNLHKLKWMIQYFIFHPKCVTLHTFKEKQKALILYRALLSILTAVFQIKANGYRFFE